MINKNFISIFQKNSTFASRFVCGFSAEMSQLKGNQVRGLNSPAAVCFFKDATFFGPLKLVSGRRGI